MEIPKSQTFKFKSMNDLVRLLVSSAHERGIANLFASTKDGKTVFFITQILPGYYQYRGLPLTAFYEYDGIIDKKFIAYKLTEQGEEWEFTNSLKTPGFQIIPIIYVESPPEFLL